MAIDFPNTPTTGDSFTTNGRTYVYNGVGWSVALFSPSQSGTTIYDTPGAVSGTITVSSSTYNTTWTGAAGLCATTADIRVDVTNYGNGYKTASIGPFNKNSSAIIGSTVTALKALPIGTMLTAGEPVTPKATSGYIDSLDYIWDTTSDLEISVDGNTLTDEDFTSYQQSVTAGVYLQAQYTTWTITPSIGTFQTLWDSGLYDLLLNGAEIPKPYTISVTGGVITLKRHGLSYSNGQAVELRLKNQPVFSMVTSDGSTKTILANRNEGFRFSAPAINVDVVSSQHHDLFPNAPAGLDIYNTVVDNPPTMAITNYGPNTSADFHIRKSDGDPGELLDTTSSELLGNIIFDGVSDSQWKAEWRIQATESGFYVNNADTSNDELNLGVSWYTWSPTLSGTGWAIGNGTIAARYMRVGRIVTANIYVAFGSTSTYGAGEPQLNIFPIGAYATNTVMFANVQLTDTSAAATYLGMSSTATSATASSCYIIPKSIGTNGLRTALSSTAPFTWASGDIIRIWFQYEASS